MIQNLRSIFTDKELEQIKNAPVSHKEHPLKRLLFASNNEAINTILATTDLAIRKISNKNSAFLGQKLKNRLLNTTDYSEADSALAEIRALGALLQTGLLVETKDGISSDFIVKERIKDSIEIRIEVASKQISDEEAQKTIRVIQGKLDDIKDKDVIQIKGETTFARSHVSCPFGRPDPSKKENSIENMISRIASIKAKEHQISNDHISCLWLDFQGEDMFFIPPVMALPFSCSNQTFNSGGLWYAFYGWQDAFIFEEFRIDGTVNNNLKFSKMKHEGRFRQNTKIDAVFISCPEATIILENPYSQKKNPSYIYQYFVNLPWFNLEFSHTNMFEDLSQRIKQEEEQIKKLVELYEEIRQRHDYLSKQSYSD